ncbi:hypothetical protein A3C59_04790 [Candidatus Daviesbacteria bacterium RIFCSPHIGHO2_02_FULL_36_13]|uniref:Kynurenine formamidase n=1 Tax=Candidatus Daviesbacteria bacterium RIFCSPHIGHO2_02_FULL_36_13 TaxID=1797768 RepID=A0A1F5JNR2_9BACT|nr:MAG: hypothetical protein A3C59_04790 [Candidatus Daviesbacteria bacterium RIFCSPHIGHO2_02_FULL_36_13]
MQFFDISLTIQNSMLVWRGDSPAEVDRFAIVEKDGYGQSNLKLTTHTGTHVDAPNHFVAGGNGVDQIPLEKLIGSCKVLDLTNIGRLEILPEDLGEVQKGDRILLKTGNYKLMKQSTFPEEYVSLSAEAAKFLAEKEINLVGIDFLGIEKEKNPGHPVHVTLLSAGVVNVEGLDLENIEPGEYELICLPLKIKDGDGSPARVVLIKR